MKTLLFASVLGFSSLLCPLRAQDFSATLNISALNTNKFSADRQAVKVSYDGGFAAALNLRLYSKHRWALRIGGGVENVNYSVTNSTNSTITYEGSRQNICGSIGLEKHLFAFNKKFNAYAGGFVPVVFVGDDKISATYNNIANSASGAGLGIVLGGNMRIEHVRFGLEYNWSYTQFKTSVWDNASTLSSASLRNTNKQLAVTIGILL